MKFENLLRWAATGFGVASAITTAVIFVWALNVVEIREWQSILHDHFAAVVGLPLAAIAAFVLVIFLRQAEGPVEFEGLGLKLKGAAGQVVLWILCFLAMAAAIKFCW